MGQSVGFDVVVIGGGIVGLASAYKISLNHPGVTIAVLEKEERLAVHQTGHNSGVIHSGLYYKPGSAKARTCAKGRKELVEFAKEHGIEHKICGKIIVATDKKQLANLERVYNRGVENEIEGIERIGPEQIKEIEPYCEGIAGIKVPCTGVIDFVKVAEKLGELIENKDGNKVLTGYEVTGFEKHDFFTRVLTGKDDLKARFIINCAGLQSDRIARMDGVDAGVRIVPFRGDYYELTEQAGEKVRNLIYPVPDPKLPFLGVHFTRLIDGSVECGPNAVFSFKREGYGKLEFSLRDTLASLSFAGTIKIFIKHCKYGLVEYARAFSKKLFLSQLQKMIPTLTEDDIKPGKCGVRAQAVSKKGELIDDFKIERKDNAIHILNAPSPAATAALAIGDHINRMATDYFRLKD